MPSVYVDTNCPECDSEVSLTFDVTVDQQWHPYGSTSVPEDISEAVLESESVCPGCGTALDTESAAEQAIDEAMEY